MQLSKMAMTKEQLKLMEEHATRRAVLMRKMMRNLNYVLAAWMFYLSCKFESGMALFWIGTNTGALATSLLLMNPKVKRYFRIKAFKGEARRPYYNLYNNTVADLISNVKSMKAKIFDNSNNSLIYNLVHYTH